MLGFIGAAPVWVFFQPWLAKRPSPDQSVAGRVSAIAVSAAHICSLAFILVYSIACVMGGAHNPFLYFRF